MFEAGVHTVCAFLEANDLIAENDLRCILYLVEQQPGEVAARERHEAPAGQFAKNAGPETGHALATIADDPHLAHAVADAIDFSQQPHSLGNVISETPEVDDVAASAQRWRMFDQGRLEACRFQPKR